MPEGLSAGEVGQEAAKHARHTDHSTQRDRLITIAEAVLLSLVTLAVAWSGYSAAKWSTESSVSLAAASAARTKANRSELESMELRNFDASTFNAWFGAYAVGNEELAAVAERRFRPTFRVAFDAWRATKPETNPDAPAGPTFMPQYRQPELARARELDREADAAFAEGSEAGGTSDKYVRVTVFLASVLFLVGLSTHFPLRGVRLGLVAVGVVLLVASVVQLAQLPRPPS